MNNIALILLGGKGKRLGNQIPKQFLLKNDIPIYIYAIKNYQNTSLITDIYLVVNEDYIDQVNSDIKKYHLDKVKGIIKGGSERFLSSYYGLEYLSKLYNEEDNVLIADAVRPNTSEQIILANIFGLMSAKAILTAIRGNPNKERKDTVHEIGMTTLLAQTPQSFKLGYIYNLYNKFIINDNFFPTDDISLVELNRDKYDVVEGEESNYKITYLEDYHRFINSK